MIAAAALLAAHVAVGLLVGQHMAVGVDRAAFDVLDDVRTRAGVDVMRTVTDLGSFPIAALAVVAGAFVAYRQQRPLVAVALIAGFALTVFLYDLAKELWDRPRPGDRLAGVSSPAYPSGHAAQAIAWLAAAWVTRRRAAIAAAAVVAIAIGLSRLYLHVHYLTDVVGGAALAGAVFLVFLRRA